YSSGRLMKAAKPLPTRDLRLILEHTAPLWEEARAQRIFITGGTGFFGCWLLESFCYIHQQLDLGASVGFLTRNVSAFSAKCPHLASASAVTLYAGDIRTFIFPAGQFSHLIHAATDTSVRADCESPLQTFGTIVGGTERVLQFASACGAKKLLLTSSGAVYGKQPADITHVPE